MEKLDRLGWAAGLRFVSHGVRIGIRVNDPGALEQVGAHLPPHWKPSASPIVDGKMVEGSLRTRSDTVNPDAFLKKAFGIDEERGAPFGGGNIRAKGAFQIPIGFLAQHKDRDQLYRLACEIIHEKFLEAIGRVEPNA